MDHVETQEFKTTSKALQLKNTLDPHQQTQQETDSFRNVRCYPNSI